MKTRIPIEIYNHRVILRRGKKCFVIDTGANMSFLDGSELQIHEHIKTVSVSIPFTGEKTTAPLHIVELDLAGRNFLFTAVINKKIANATWQGLEDFEQIGLIGIDFLLQTQCGLHLHGTKSYLELP